jgi:hypothetical protein
MEFSKGTLATAALVAVVFSFITHEYGHWLAGEILGYDMVMTLNMGYPKGSRWNTTEDYMIVSAIGPTITLITSVVIYFLIRAMGSKYWFTLLFSCFYLELLSGVLNYRHANDLGRIGEYFNIGLFTLSSFFVFVHGWLFYLTIIKNRYSRAFVVQTLLWILLFSSIWIIFNQKFKIVLIS